MQVLRDFLICVPATAFFSILFNTPRKAIWAVSLLGGLGYAVYDLVNPSLHSQIAGYFTGTLVMAVLGEILARIFKKPATVFVIPALVPLVPGIGLYNTMIDLIEGQNRMAAVTGTATLLALVSIATAMILTMVLTRFSTILRLEFKRFRSRF